MVISNLIEISKAYNKTYLRLKSGERIWLLDDIKIREQGMLGASVFNKIQNFISIIVGLLVYKVLLFVSYEFFTLANMALPGGYSVGGWQSSWYSSSNIVEQEQRYYVGCKAVSLLGYIAGELWSLLAPMIVAIKAPDMVLRSVLAPLGRSDSCLRRESVNAYFYLNAFHTRGAKVWIYVMSVLSRWVLLFCMAPSAPDDGFGILLILAVSFYMLGGVVISVFLLAGVAYLLYKFFRSGVKYGYWMKLLSRELGEMSSRGVFVDSEAMFRRGMFAGAAAFFLLIVVPVIGVVFAAKIDCWGVSNLGGSGL